jgi:hypothetical protein
MLAGVLPDGRAVELSLRRVRFSCAALACDAGSTAPSSYTVRVVSDYGLLDGSLRAQAQSVGVQRTHTCSYERTSQLPVHLVSDTRHMWLNHAVAHVLCTLRAGVCAPVCLSLLGPVGRAGLALRL